MVTKKYITFTWNLTNQTVWKSPQVVKSKIVVNRKENKYWKSTTTPGPESMTETSQD